jgi:DNA-directed RNA polymerase subunit RPC12/RpoP
LIKIRCPYCNYVGLVDEGDVETCASCGETFYVGGDEDERKGDYESE